MVTLEVCLAVPQLVADLCQASIEWPVCWFGCVGGSVCCPSMVLCGLDLAVGSLSIRCGGKRVDLLVVSKLCPSDVSFANEVGGMVLTWLGVGG